MPTRVFRLSLACATGLLLTVLGLGSGLLSGCGPSSEQMVDREAPAYKDAMKASANAYINREAEGKKARGKRAR